MGNFILKGWDNGMIMRNKKRKLRSGQEGGKGVMRLCYPGSRVKSVPQPGDCGQLCQMLWMGWLRWGLTTESWIKQHGGR